MAKERWVTSPRVVEKPWGQEQIFAEVEGKYVGKHIFVKAGESLSLQYHEKKDETMFAIKGVARFEMGENESDLESFEVEAGDVVRVPPFRRHRVTAVTDFTFLEASTDDLMDVIRLDDKYGREGTNAP